MRGWGGRWGGEGAATAKSTLEVATVNLEKEAFLAGMIVGEGRTGQWG